MTTKGLSLQGQIAAIRREIALRRQLYPRQVNARKMKQGEADYEIGAMESVLATLLFVERNLPTIESAVQQRAAAKSGGGGVHECPPDRSRRVSGSAARP